METTFNLSGDNLVFFYGANNDNLRILSDRFPSVRFIGRGNSIKLIGEEDDFFYALEVVKKCIDRFERKEVLSVEDVKNIIQMPRWDDNEGKRMITHNSLGYPIVTINSSQYKMAELFESHSLLFAIGPAGSGKTYIAIALAVMALKNKLVKRIILSRPAVEAGEKIGFLPGDMKEKIDPYLQPIYDALRDLFDREKLDDCIKKNIIQIAPLAFMRGRTLSDAAIVLDEAQNTTPLQLKMFLTRLGHNSKMIVTGDLTQTDLPGTQISGLKDAVERLCKIKEIAFVHFSQKEIIRHPLVKQIVNAYNSGSDNDVSRKSKE